MGRPLQRDLLSTEVVRDPRAKGVYHQKCSIAWGASKKVYPIAIQDMRQQKMRTDVFPLESMILRMNHIMPEELLPLEAIDHIVAFDYWNDHTDQL